jgi:hypothetical protein
LSLRRFSGDCLNGGGPDSEAAFVGGGSPSQAPVLLRRGRLYPGTCDTAPTSPRLSKSFRRERQKDSQNLTGVSKYHLLRCVPYRRTHEIPKTIQRSLTISGMCGARAEEKTRKIREVYCGALREDAAIAVSDRRSHHSRVPVGSWCHIPSVYLRSLTCPWFARLRGVAVTERGRLGSSGVTRIPDSPRIIVYVVSQAGQSQ